MEDDFNPQVYNFTLSPEFADSLLCWEVNNYDVEMPSFSVLLDHTIAVIWHVFSEDGRELINLNKSDIAWALRFLESIEVKDGCESEDLRGLIAHLRKLLIARYAMEDEREVSINNQTLLDTMKPDFESSSAILDEYLNSPEVMEDRGKSLSLEQVARESKCTDGEIVDKLKSLRDGGTVLLQEAIDMFDKSE